jgi:hypothetical protein
MYGGDSTAARTPSLQLDWPSAAKPFFVRYTGRSQQNDVKNEPTREGQRNDDGGRENVTNEPTDTCENVTNEPTVASENVTNEPTVPHEIATNEPTVDCENVTNEPAVASDVGLAAISHRITKHRMPFGT